MKSTVLILAGGFGTRLQSAVPDKPKVLAPVGEHPFLFFLLNSLEQQGATQVVLSLHHQSDQVLEYLAKNKTRWNMTVECVVEPKPLGTGGAVRFSLQRYPYVDHWVCMNGDTFMPNGFEQICQPPFDQESFLVGVLKLEDSARYGLVKFEFSTGKISGFLEKKSDGFGGYINAGIYAFPRSLIQLEKDSFSLERDLVPLLVEQERACVRVLDTSFIDIGVPEDYQLFLNTMNERV